MKNMLNKTKFVAVLSTGILLLNSKVCFASNYNVLQTKSTVATNKEWKIKFNRQLISNTVNTSNIKVTDEKDKEISINVSLDKSLKTIIVKPYGNYVEGKTYHLYISDKIVSKDDNEKLSKPIQMDFLINNVYSGLPAEDGLIILKNTAYSVDYLATNNKLKNEIIKDYDHIYYYYDVSKQKIKDVLGDVDVDGKHRPYYKYNTMTYVDREGRKHTYEWSSKDSEYKLVPPSVDANISVASDAKLVTVKVNRIKGIEGAKYFRLEHSNLIKRPGESIAFTTVNSTERIYVLADDKSVLAEGTINTNKNSSGLNTVRMLDEKTSGNTAGNINNNGITAVDNDGYVYYDNVGDKSRLYKLDSSGETNIPIAEDEAQYINVVEDWVYFSNYSDKGKLYRVKRDGSAREKVLDDMAAYVTVSGNYIYYSNHSDGGKLYRIRKDGSDITKDSSGDRHGRPVFDNYGHRFDDEVAFIDVVGDWIYYTNISDNHRPYVVNKEISYRAKLSDEWANSIQVDGGWVYYTSRAGVLSKVRKDGTGGTMPIKGKARQVDKGFHLNVVGDWIYYSNAEDGGRLYKISTDGSGQKTKVSNDSVTYINIAENSIYYISANKLYKLPIDADASVKPEIVGKPKENKKVKQIDDLKITVPYSEVNDEKEELERRYLPEKVPGIVDDNTMHQFVVIWNKDKVQFRNGVYTYTGNVIGYNKTIKLEMIIPSEMLNSSNTINVYNNSRRNSDVIEVSDDLRNRNTSQVRIKEGDEVNVYATKDCVRSLGKATVKRDGIRLVAKVQRLELDTYGSDSIYVTVRRENKAQSEPTEVVQAEAPILRYASDEDSSYYKVDGRDFTIQGNWVPSTKNGAETNHSVYIIPAGGALEIDKTTAITDVLRNGQQWQGNESIKKDSKGAAFRTGRYDVFIVGRFSNYGTEDNKSSRPKVEGYICSQPVTVRTFDDMLPQRPNISDIYIRGGQTITLRTSLKKDVDEWAWIAPDDRKFRWKYADGTPSPFVEGSTITKMKDTDKKEIVAPEREGKYKLYVVNDVGASEPSARTITVDNTAPVLDIINKDEFDSKGNTGNAGKKIRVKSSENATIYLVDQNYELQHDNKYGVDYVTDENNLKKAAIKSMRVTAKNPNNYIDTTGIPTDDENTKYYEYQVVVVDAAGNCQKEVVVIYRYVTELRNKIGEANNLTKSDRFKQSTRASQDKLLNTIAKAEGVSENEKVTQAEIEKMIRELDQAMQLQNSDPIISPDRIGIYEGSVDDAEIGITYNGNELMGIYDNISGIRKLRPDQYNVDIDKGLVTINKSYLEDLVDKAKLGYADKSFTLIFWFQDDNHKEYKINLTIEVQLKPESKMKP